MICVDSNCLPAQVHCRHFDYLLRPSWTLRSINKVHLLRLLRMGPSRMPVFTLPTIAIKLMPRNSRWIVYWVPGLSSQELGNIWEARLNRLTSENSLGRRRNAQAGAIIQPHRNIVACAVSGTGTLAKFASMRSIGRLQSNVIRGTARHNRNLLPWL